MKEELENMNKKKNGCPFVYTDRFVILLAIIKSRLIDYLRVEFVEKQQQAILHYKYKFIHQ